MRKHVHVRWWQHRLVIHEPVLHPLPAIASPCGTSLLYELVLHASMYFAALLCEVFLRVPGMRAGKSEALAALVRADPAAAGGREEEGDRGRGQGPALRD